MLRFVLNMGLALIVTWACLILYFAPLFTYGIRSFLSALLLISYILTFLVRRHRAAIKGFLFLQLLFAFYSWNNLEARTDRNWATEYALMPSFQIAGDVITIRNVRNLQYNSAGEPTAAYYDKSVRLSELSGLDIFVSYWAGKRIAHIMISFGFADKDFVAISVETRREANEAYSTIAGFFGNYELMYVVADERDLIRLRTIYRKPPESVYLLRTNMALATARRFFLDYAGTINELATRPKFYNTLLTNCTSQVLFHTRVNQDALHYNWKVLLSGYVPEYLYEIKALAPDMTLEQLMEIGKVNNASIQAGNGDDFSLRIREGVPRPIPVED